MKDKTILPPFIITETLFDRNVFNDLNLQAPKPFQPQYFEEIDSDKNNKISYKEFYDYFKKRGIPDVDINELFSTYDVNKDGNLSKQEFYKLQ